jgi:hypothetical protein
MLWNDLKNVHWNSKTTTGTREKESQKTLLPISSDQAYREEFKDSTRAPTHLA